MEDRMQTGEEAGGESQQSLLDFSKERISHQFDEASTFVRKACEGLDEGGGVSRFADRAAATLTDAGRYIAGADPRNLVKDANSFAHRQPEVFLGGAFLSGLLLGRFLRSRPPDQSARSDQPHSPMGFHPQTQHDERIQTSADASRTTPNETTPYEASGEGEVSRGS